MLEVYALVVGTVYGLVIGILPSSGATTGLLLCVPFLSYFGDQYIIVIFLMAMVAASTTGDSYTSILLGIPGADSAAASMVDGYPLTQQGKGAYALSVALTTSTVNGLIWGGLTFLLLPYYGRLVYVFGVPELWMFVVLALATVTFTTNKWWFRSLCAVFIGMWLGLIGVDPTTNVYRWTFGIEYLNGGVQLITLMAGVFAIPELVDGLLNRQTSSNIVVVDNRQTVEGIVDSWKHRWLMLKGGVVGAVIGFLPGLGGGMADWTAYGMAVGSTKNPEPRFGKGNIRGVVGPEGANNAQKATSMIPTVLFGIPGAPFAAILTGIFTYIGFDLGSVNLLNDTKFISAMSYGFLAATILVYIICMCTLRYINKLTKADFKYYFPILLLMVAWTCVQYTGGIGDYVSLAVFTVLGFACKKYKISRPSLIIGFILVDKLELLTIQMVGIYDIGNVVTRPAFILLLLATIAMLVFGFKNKDKLEYT